MRLVFKSEKRERERERERDLYNRWAEGIASKRGKSKE